MFKRSNSKEKKAPRPQYINAAIRNMNTAAGVPSTKSLAHTSSIDITDAHAKILGEIAVSGRIPFSAKAAPGCSPAARGASTRSASPSSPTGGLSWEVVRDEVYKPYIEKLLAISLACRSDVNLPNGRWIGSGSPPAGVGSSDNGGSGGNGSAASLPRGTPSTAPNTPVGGDASVFSNGKKKSGASDSDSDDNANTLKRSVTETSSNLNSIATDIVPSVLDKADFESENEYILDQWCSLSAPTFTLQRLAEIILQHRRYSCYSTELPFGPATITGADGSTMAALRGSVDGSRASRSATPNRAERDASVPPRSPRSQGVLRGEKLQASIRRCVLVASLDTL